MPAIILLLLSIISQRYDPPRDAVDCIEVNEVIAAFAYKELVFWEYEEGEWLIVDSRIDDYQWRFNAAGTEVLVWDIGPPPRDYRVVKTKLSIETKGFESVESWHRNNHPDQKRRLLNGPEPTGIDP